MTLEIRKHPDPVLRAVCAPVEAFDGALGTLAWQMARTMYAAPGRGLAAPQVGVTRRLFVVDTDWRDGTPAPEVFCNPEIQAVSETLVDGEEGCLSIPDTPCRVRRPEAVALRWQALDGDWRVGAFQGIAARCILHELDHLDGVLCIDRDLGSDE